jgi:ethanolamine-phosphate cytidylyltransferase
MIAHLVLIVFTTSVVLLLQRGDYVIVGIHGDSVVNKRRGGNLPLMNLHERLLSVLGCKFMNDVLIDAPLEITPDMIASLRISEVVHGTKSDDKSDSSDMSYGMSLLFCLLAISSWQSFNRMEFLTYASSHLHCLLRRHYKDDRYRYPKEMGIFTTISSPSDFKLENILSRIQKKQAELQRKIDRKKRAEREWFDNKYQNGEKVGNGKGAVK